MAAADSEKTHLFFGRPKKGSGDEEGPQTLQTLQERSEARRRAFAKRAMVYVSAYLALGIITYMSTGMSFVDAALYSIVITTTVGYGAEADSTFAKLFTCGYIMLDFFLIAGLLGYLVGVLLEKQERIIENAMAGKSGDRKWSASMAAVRQTCPKMMSSAVALLGFVAVGVIVYKFTDDLSIIDAFYLVCVTISTTGLGDIEPVSYAAKVFSLFYLPIATLGLGKVLSDYADMRTQARAHEMQRRILDARVDTTRFLNMDSNHDGRVDKLEYLCELLVTQGKCEKGDIDAILTKFDILDSNLTGYLTRSEVGAI